MFRLIPVALVLLGLGCAIQNRPKGQDVEHPPAATQPSEVERLRDAGKALDAFTDWRNRWFHGPARHKAKRPFKGGPEDVSRAVEELQELKDRWPETPAAQRAARMQKMLLDVLGRGLTGNEFKLRMAELCAEEIDQTLAEDDE